MMCLSVAFRTNSDAIGSFVATTRAARLEVVATDHPFGKIKAADFTEG